MLELEKAKSKRENYIPNILHKEQQSFEKDMFSPVMHSVQFIPRQLYNGFLLASTTARTIIKAHMVTVIPVKVFIFVTMTANKPTINKL